MSFTISWPFGHTHATSHTQARHRRGTPLPQLARDERVLCRVDTATATSVATNQALLLTEGIAAWRRIDWADVAALDRSLTDDRLAVRLWPDVAGRHSLIATVADQRLIDVARERISAAQVLRVPVKVNGHTGAVLALRRGDGISWRVVFDRPVDDPSTRTAAAEVLAEIRGIAGV